MKYIKLWIGDYQRDTAHLSLAEHGAYFQMLLHHYATQAKLPTGKALYRLLRADSKSERDAIDSVIAQFWTLTADGSGFVNKRADQEIQKSEHQAEANRAIAVAREEKKRSTKDARTEHDSCSTRSTKREPTHSHSHRKPIPKTSALGATTPKPDQPPTAADVSVEPVQARAIELSVLLRQRGASLQAMDPRVIGWAKTGITDAQALTALETAERRRQEQADSTPINAGYLDAIIAANRLPNAPKNHRRTIHDERAETIAVLTGRDREKAGRIIEITPDGVD